MIYTAIAIIVWIIMSFIFTGWLIYYEPDEYSGYPVLAFLVGLTTWPIAVCFYIIYKILNFIVSPAFAVAGFLSKMSNKDGD